MEYAFEELLPIVADLTNRFTSKESTSVTYEIAQQLMEAILYCIQENEISLYDRNNDEVLNKNKFSNAKEAYDIGYQLVFNKVLRTKELYEIIIIDFHAYGNHDYYSTVIKGMPAFFTHYDVKFYPQSHILTLDYPLIKPIMNASGVDEIWNYLTCIQLEQVFLNKFPEKYVCDVLSHFYSDYDYKDLLINICSTVLRNILGCMIANKSISQIGFSEADYARIILFVNHNTSDSLKEKIMELLELLIQQQYENNQPLLAYLQNDVDDFSFELMNAVQNHYLANFLP